MSQPSAPIFDRAGILPFVQNTSIKFYWTQSIPVNPNTISSYRLYSAQDPQSPYNIRAPANIYQVNNLTNGTTYTYSINATDSAGNVSPSSIYATVQASLPPNAPINVKVSTLTNTSAIITWTTASVSDSSRIAGYQINALPNNFNIYPGTTCNVGLSIEPLKTSQYITYANQPSSLSIQAGTSGGYSLFAYAPFIANDYILRVDPYMYQSATSTITDITSTYTYSSIGAGPNISFQNLFFQFSSGKYLQGPTFSNLSTYTLSSWVRTSATNSGYILGDRNTNSYLNIALSTNNMIYKSFSYPSSLLIGGGGGGGPTQGSAGGGGGFGGGGGCIGGPGAAAGGGSFTLGGTIYNGSGMVQGFCNSPKNPNNYGAGQLSGTTPSSGFIVLSYFDANGKTLGPDLQLSNAGLNIPSILPSTNYITAYLWGGAGSSIPATGNNGGGGGACVVQSFTYFSTLYCFVGGGGNGTIGGVGGGASGGSATGGGGGGGASYLIMNSNIIAVAGGGGGGPNGGGGGEDGIHGPLGSFGVAGSNGIGGQGINGGALAGSTIRISTLTFSSFVGPTWTQLGVTYNNSFSIYQNGSTIALNASVNSTISSGNTAFQFGSSFIGNIGQTIVYNRVLNSQEMANNFQATRYIYGV